MSLFPAKKKSGGRDGGGASTIAGSTSEETTPLFPKIGRTPTNYVDFGSSGGGGGDDGSGRDGGSSRSGGGGDAFPELFDKSTRFKSMTRKERELIFGVPNVVPKRADAQLHELVYQLFEYEHHHSHAHPRTNPQLPPEKVRLKSRDFHRSISVVSSLRCQRTAAPCCHHCCDLETSATVDRSAVECIRRVFVLS